MEVTELELKFDDRGLVPAVVQDADTHEVLMVAYMNAESVRRTLDSGDAWFWSRSRSELWHKGETSGNYQRVAKARTDCDADTILLEVHPDGPACHTGATSCFFEDIERPTEADSEPEHNAVPAIMEELAGVIAKLSVPSLATAWSVAGGISTRSPTSSLWVSPVADIVPLPFTTMYTCSASSCERSSSDAPAGTSSQFGDSAVRGSDATTRLSTGSSADMPQASS